MCYIIFIVSLLHVLVTFFAHLQEGIFFEVYMAKTAKPVYIYKILTFKYVIHNIC